MCSVPFNICARIVYKRESICLAYIFHERFESPLFFKQYVNQGPLVWIVDQTAIVLMLRTVITSTVAVLIMYVRLVGKDSTVVLVR